MFNRVFDKCINFIKREYKFLILISIIIFLGLFKLPYNLFLNGGTINIADKIKIQDEYKENGSYNMAYVKSMRATIPSYLLSYIFDWERESINDMKWDENDNANDIWERELIYLQEANDNAIISAYTKAKEDINVKKELLKVLYVDKDSKTDLQTGDIILKIDNKEIKVFEDIKEILKNFNVGDKVKVNYSHDGKEMESYFIVREIDSEKKAGIYIAKLYEYDLKRKIDLEFSDSEGGSSGGLMLSLAIYDRLVEEDLAKGRKIVGTGTIDEKGNVGPIGAVKYKVKGAYYGDADIFFVPSDNYEEAMKYKEEKGYDLNIVKVDTLDEAIEYLRRN